MHRPDFSVILNILKSGIFMNLLAAFPLLDNKEVITASCMRTFYGQKFSGSVTHSHSTMLDQSLASLGVTSLIYGKSAAYGEESTTQVWYGTEFGKCGVVQFQNTGITHEVYIIAAINLFHQVRYFSNHVVYNGVAKYKSLCIILINDEKSILYSRKFLRGNIFEV